MKLKLVMALAIIGFSQISTPVGAQLFVGRVPLDNATAVPWSRVPAPVRQTFQNYSGNSSLAGVQRGTLNGAMVYRAGIYQNGEPFEILVGVDGSPYLPLNNMARNEVSVTLQDGYNSVDNWRAAQEIPPPNQTFYGLGATYNTYPQNTEEPAPVEIIVQSEVQEEQAEAPTEGDQASPPPGSIITESAGASRNYITRTAPQAQSMMREQIPFENLSMAAQQTTTWLIGGAPILGIKPSVVNGVLCYAVQYNQGGELGTAWIANDGQLIQSSQ